jgi:MFS family permease
MVFVVFGFTGLVWAAVWFRWCRNDPSEHPQVSPAERALIVSERAPDGGHHEGWAYWKRLLCHRNTAPLCLMYFPNTFAFYFCITWLPSYLKEKHGFDTVQLGLFAGLPLILSVIGDLFGGLTTDAVTRRFGLRAGRCAVGASAYVLAGAAMIFSGVVHQPLLAATLIAVAVAASMFVLAAAWSTCLDIGGNHSGVVSAAMNTSGALSSVASPLLVTWLLHHFSNNWSIPLFVMGGLFLMGAVCWGFIDPRKRIFD